MKKIIANESPYREGQLTPPVAPKFDWMGFGLNLIQYPIKAIGWWFAAKDSEYRYMISTQAVIRSILTGLFIVVFGIVKLIKHDTAIDQVNCNRNGLNNVRVYVHSLYERSSAYATITPTDNICQYTVVVDRYGATV